MGNNIKAKKLVLVEVLSESMRLYKNNFSLLFKLNAIGVLILLLSSNFIRLKGIVDIFELNLLISFIGMILMYVGLYYNLRVTVALILAIKDRYNDRKVRIKDIYNRSKGYIWKYIGTGLLLGLMMIIPLSFIMFGLSRVDSIILKAVIIIVGAIPLSYIMVNYGLALYVRIFKPGIKNYFTYSKKLVANYFWEVFCILLVPFLVQAPNTIMRFFIDESTLGLIEGIIYNNIGQVITLVAGPFMTGIMVIAYLKLDKK